MTDTIKLVCAQKEDLPLLLQMQQSAFGALYRKYRDHDTSPAAETLKTVTTRFRDRDSTYFFIMAGHKTIGAARVIHTPDSGIARISPMFILPRHQYRGAGRQAASLLEEGYPEVTLWKVETIKQEPRLSSFYRQLGFTETGEVRSLKPGMDIVYFEKSRSL